MQTVLVTGGTGLIGQNLSQLLTEKGYKVIHLSRKRNLQATFPAYQWDIPKGHIDKEALQQADFIITLAGAGVADRRWSSARKKLIIDSRVNGILLIKKHLQELNISPKAIIGASAIGFYGNSGAAVVNEATKAGTGFLSESVIAWENAYKAFDELKIDLTVLRVGIVLSTKGGALQKMLPTYKAGFGTYFGNGGQVYSWIHIDDICRIFCHLLKQKAGGVFNGVSPNPVSNKELAKAIAVAKNMNEVVFPAPAFVMKTVLGEMSSVVLDGSNVSSKKIEQANFQFKHPELVPALKDLLKRKI